jgi:hypothetical protein
MMEGIQQTIFNRVSSFKQSGGKLKSSEQYKNERHTANFLAMNF